MGRCELTISTDGFNAYSKFAAFDKNSRILAERIIQSHEGIDIMNSLVGLGVSRGVVSQEMLKGKSAVKYQLDIPYTTSGGEQLRDKYFLVVETENPLNFPIVNRTMPRIEGN